MTRATARASHRYHRHGWFDIWLGIDRFWSEKWLLLFLWLQDFALLWIWPYRWPWHFWGRTHFLLFSILDFRTRRWQMQPCNSTCAWPDCKPDGCTFTLDVITVFEDEDEPKRSVGGNFFTIGGGALLYVLWVVIGRLVDVGMVGPSIGRNIERLMVPLLTIMYAPLLVQSLYAICAFKSFTVEQWECRPDGQSVVWILLGSVFALGYPMLIAWRVQAHSVYKSRLRHETMLRTRELEYVLRLNTIYRDSRIWLLSCFTQVGSRTLVYHLMHKLAMVLLIGLSRSPIAIADWASDDQDSPLAPDLLPRWDKPVIQTLGAFATALFAVPAILLSSGVVRLYRVRTTHYCQLLFLWGHTCNATLGWFNVLEVKNPLLVDRDARLFLAWLNFSIVCLFLAMLCVFYWWTHDFLVVLPWFRDPVRDREKQVQEATRYRAALACSKENAVHQHLGRALPILIQEELKKRKILRGEEVPEPEKAVTEPDKEADAAPDILLVPERGAKWLPLPRQWPMQPRRRSTGGSGIVKFQAFGGEGASEAGEEQGAFTVRVRLASADTVSDPAAFRASLLHIAGEPENGVQVSVEAAPPERDKEEEEEEELEEKGEGGAELAVIYSGGSGPAARAAVSFSDRCADPEDDLARQLHVGRARLLDPEGAKETASAPPRRQSKGSGEDPFGQKRGSLHSVGTDSTDARNSEKKEGEEEEEEEEEEGVWLSWGNTAKDQNEEKTGDQRPPSACGSEDYEITMLSVLSGRELTDAALFGDYWADEDGDDLEDIDAGYRCFPPSTNVGFAWPVGHALIAEMIRDNRTNHFLDVLREAGAVLMEVNLLHSTPELIRAETILFHLRRVRRCLRQLSKLRVVHHIHAIHPLSSTFDETLDQLVYELKEHKDRAQAVGERAAKLPIVSAYLHHRMNDREEYMALYSPVMRRVMLKLLVLRMFQQLISKASDKLFPGGRRKRISGEASEPDPFGAFGGADLEQREGTGDSGGFMGRKISQATSGTTDSGGAFAGATAPWGAEFGQPAAPEDDEIYESPYIEMWYGQLEDEEIGRDQYVCEEEVTREDMVTAEHWSRQAARKAAERRKDNDTKHATERREFERRQMEQYQQMRDEEEIEWEVWQELLDELHQEAQRVSRAAAQRLKVQSEEGSGRLKVEEEEREELRQHRREKEIHYLRCTDKEEQRRLEEARETDLRQFRERIGDGDGEDLSEREGTGHSGDGDISRSPLAPPGERKQRKRWLTERLNKWKKEYREERGKDPTKKAFRSEPEVAALWEEYQAMKEGRWRSPGEWDPPEKPEEAESPSRRESEAKAERPAPQSPEALGKRRKKILAGQLNEWKQGYKQRHGKDPTKSAFKADPHAERLYTEYQALQDGTWWDKYGALAAAAAGGEWDVGAATPERHAPLPVDPKQRKKELAGLLNQWKKQYKEEHGKDPTKRTLSADPEVAPLYAEYAALQDGSWQEKYGGGAAEGSPAPGPSPEGGGDAPPPGPEDERRRQKARKRQIVAELNAWKAEYKERTGKEATKRQIREDPVAAPLYDEYLALQEAKVERRASLAGSTGARSEPDESAATGPDTGGETDGQSASGSPSRRKRGAEAKEQKRRRQILADRLQQWKQQYKEQHGKDPTKKQLLADPEVAPLFQEYQELQQLKKEAKAGRRQSDAGSAPPPEEEAAALAAEAEGAAPGAAEPAPEPAIAVPVEGAEEGEGEEDEYTFR
eukprot:TRINITY_DN1210_c0_g4_i1.p1 TRINITY_DN1210_c0_g4~~TRINITY_DN1210_c0_g4_i1.p1  ORF type:complete len:1716 (+),score=608.45 TRINITY_DN1210_c0_g4_i1:128-5275(+)